MKIKVSLTHTDLVNLICGRFPPQSATKWTVFTGNQWNEEWSWDRALIGKEGIEDLARYYFGDRYSVENE